MSDRFRRPWAVAIRAPLGIGLTVALLGTGCSAGGADRDGTGGAGGTLTFALAIDPTCLDPQQTTLTASLNIGRQLVDSLVDQDPTTGEFTPWLAESWQVDAKATTFTFRLREGATFSDGTPVTSASIKANLDAVAELGARAQLGAGYLAGYVGTTVVDERTARVEFDRPSAQFLQAASTMVLGLLSDASLAKSADERCQGALVGSGPFTLDHYRPNQEVSISKRPDYSWGSALFERQGDALLDKIVYKVVPESGVRSGSLASGQVSAISDVPPQDEPQFDGKGFRLMVRGNPGVPFNLHPNASRPVLGDEAVRLAIQQGINRAEVVETVLSANYRAATSILSHTTPGYTDLSGQLAYDPEAAERRLDAAGWQPGQDGVRVKDGRRLSVEVLFNTAYNGSQSVLELVQQQLRKIGVELRLRQLTVAEQATRQSSGDYDFLWYNQTRADPDVLRSLFSTKATNRTRIAPGPLDEVLDAQATTTESQLRNQYVAEAQQLIVERGYSIPVFELSQVHGLGQQVDGLRFDASSRLTFHGAQVTG
ncbi:ABC transporter substrate-binding protein [Solwaraspora sp. WMMD1047]|uniref:ABC transporter substrate-binding protein n=1 Tax=Solwaraspora sp. WMMD1047 TaxID=3016102 RepID=UPI0024167095|nr:ABC transporter substrate-binding protein [Solwaraspora sp. WMMD1047]MDG4834247.1 ABC transporter substrate-binding protein [Solwaraspora sp. WMMD1047]